MDQTSPPAVMGGPCAPLDRLPRDAERGLVCIAWSPLSHGT